MDFSLDKLWEKFWNKAFVSQITPVEPTHKVKMNIEIKKGQIEGTVLVPCAIYTLTHGIDLNPSLIKKKTKEVVKNFKFGEKIAYDPKTEKVVLTEEEKKMLEENPDKKIEWEEYERCPHCGQKAVVATVSETRYRSCPSIAVKLSDAAKEDVVIPVEFGLIKKDVRNAIWLPFVVAGVTFGLVANNLTLFQPADWLHALGLLVASLAVSYFVACIFYSGFKMWDWWRAVKDSLTEVAKQ